MPSPSRPGLGKPGFVGLLALLTLFTLRALLPAEAAPARAGLVALLPPTGIVGDGVTPADLYLVTLDAAGQPAKELKLRAYTRFGVAEETPVDLGNGLSRVRYTPLVQERSEILSFELNGKIGKANVKLDAPFHVRVNPARTLAMTVSPTALTFGVEPSASIALTVTSRDLAHLELVVAASAGTISNLTNLGNGQFNALYTPPPDNVPRQVVITAGDRRDPSSVYAHLELPISGTATPTVSGPKGSRALLRVGSREFGPVPTDSKGRAKVPITIEPGVTSATVLSLNADGTTTESVLDLKVPEALRAAFVPTSNVPGDPTLVVPLHLVVRTRDGKPDTAAAPIVTATLGKIGTPTHVGDGVYAVPYSPPIGTSATADTVTATLGAGPAATLKIPILAARPGGVTLAATPPVRPIGPVLNILASVAGPQGAPLPGRSLTWQANGAREGATKDLKNGTYQAPFTPFGTGPVEVEGRVCTPASGNPLAQLLILPDREHVKPDGLSVVRFTAIGVDHFGYPVADLDLDLSLVSGDGALPAKVRTDGCGMGAVYYTAGSTPGLVVVRAVYNSDVEAHAVVYQAAAPFPVPLPLSGPSSLGALVQAWRGSFAEIRVE